jgi:hypothetical protein
MRLQAPLTPSLIAVVTLLIAPMSAFAASPSPEASDTVLRIGVTNEPNTAAVLGDAVPTRSRPP